jgi:glutaconate CoA-transferase subunit A
MSLVKSNTPQFVTLGALIDRVESGDRFSIGGHHFARLPIAALLEVVKRKINRLKYFAWAGGLPLELLLEAEAVAEIEICFSSLDIFGLAPRFRKVAEEGIICVRDWPALALIQGLRAAQQNLPFMPVQIPAGSDMMARCPALRPYRDLDSARDIALVSAQTIDTLLVHAPRADAAGNVEIFGAKALDLAQVGAARKVLVTVEEIVPAGSLGRNGRHTILTRNQITAIAEVPGGAYPASCLPFYVTDYARIHTLLEGKLGTLAEGLALPLDAPGPLLRQAARVPARAIRSEAFRTDAKNDAPASIDEIMAVRISRMLDNDGFASAGAVSPLANVSYRLAKATHAPDLFIGTFSCGHVDIGAGVMTLSLLEPMDADTAVMHAGGDETYSTYYQAGAVTHEIIGAAQVDQRGRVNNMELTKPSGGKLRLPGQGGMSDVANMHRDYVIYVTRHSPKTLVKDIAVASSARGIISAKDRAAHGYRAGDIWLVTDLCLFRFDEDHDQLVVVEIMPEVDRATIEKETGFPVVFAPDCFEVAMPSVHELTVLREQVDPLGIRRLEFIGAKDRGPLIEEILRRDRLGTEAVVQQCRLLG